jgi:hypothetical protein
VIGVPFTATSLDGIEVSWFCDGNGFFGKGLISIFNQSKNTVSLSLMLLFIILYS